MGVWDCMMDNQKGGEERGGLFCPKESPGRESEVQSFSIRLSLEVLASRLRPDQQHLENEEYDMENAEKLHLEMRQRMIELGVIVRRGGEEFGVDESELRLSEP
ncbi:oxysterol-binding protein [Tanacetum coccineum]